VADAYAREGFFARAAGFYKKLLKIDPDNAVVIAKLGEVTARQGLIVEAAAHFRSLARLLEARGDAKGVAEVMARIERLEHGPRAGSAAGTARQLAQAERTERAEVPAEQLDATFGERREAAARPESPSTTRLALARTYVAAGLMAEARPILEALHAERPGDLDAASLLADVLQRAGEAGAAVACLERVAAAHPDPSPARVTALKRLGDALEHAGQRARALSAWREALVQAPGDRELNERLARASATGGGSFTR
jgi:tetratricopeptide (TPR) repeat protein